MEASLHLSGGPKSVTTDSPVLRVPVSGAARIQNPGRGVSSTAAPAPQLSTAHAPSVALPLRFMITGLIAFACGIAWLVLQPMVLATYHYNQHVIAVTHLFVLGWISTIVMGAMYQLVPVALETRLHSERLAKWQFAFHVVGFAGMVWMFKAWNLKQVGHYGCVLGVGVLLFMYNIVRTLARVPKWNVVASAVASAVGWIGLTVLAGLVVAAGKSSFDIDPESTSPYVAPLKAIAALLGKFDAISVMHAHAHLGVIGFFIMMIVGVSYKLIPMFTLSEIQSRRRAMLSVLLLNVGLVGSFACILTRSPWKIAFAGVIALALGIYGWELVAILRARRRGPMDWGIRYFLTAVALLAPLSVLGVTLAWPGLPLTLVTGQMENAYGFVGIVGVISFAIMGMLYKIVPFLVWFGTYSRHIGRAKVPALADMYSTRLQALGYWSFLAGLGVTTAAVLLSSEGWVRAGAGLLALSVASLLVNAGSMIRHFFKPKLAPLAPQPLAARRNL